MGQFGCPKFFLRLRQNPGGGPPRIRAPSRKSLPFEIARRHTRNEIRKRTGSPPKYLQAQRGRWRARAAMYTHSWTRAQPGVCLETSHTRCFIVTAVFFTIATTEQLDWCGALSERPHTGGYHETFPSHCSIVAMFHFQDHFLGVIQPQLSPCSLTQVILSNNHQLPAVLRTAVFLATARNPIEKKSEKVSPKIKVN